MKSNGRAPLLYPLSVSLTGNAAEASSEEQRAEQGREREGEQQHAACDTRGDGGGVRRGRIPCASS